MRFLRLGVGLLRRHLGDSGSEISWWYNICIENGARKNVCHTGFMMTIPPCSFS